MDNAIVSSADGAGGGGGGLPVSSTAQHEGEKRLTQPNVTETPQKVGDESSSSILKGNKPSSKIGSSGGSGIRAKDESSDAKKRKTARRKKKDDAAALSNRSRAGGVEGSGGHAASPSASRSISSAPVHAASAAAVRAERELEEQRANAEARRNDAAWLNGGVIPVALEQRKHGWIREAGGQHSGGQKGFLAEEIAIVERSLKTNGLRRIDVTPQAYGCLIEHARRYACELVADAQHYAWHCSRREVDGSDLRLAADMRDDTTVEQCLPPRSRMLALAEEVNRVPLPPIPSHCYNGIVLPSEEHRLTARTFDVVSSSKAPSRVLEQEFFPHSKSPTVPPNHVSLDAGLPSSMRGVVSKSQSSSSTRTNAGAGLYGASKGTQIPINIKSPPLIGGNSDIDTKNISNGNEGATMISKGASMTVDSRAVPPKSSESNGSTTTALVQQTAAPLSEAVAMAAGGSGASKRKADEL